MHGKWYLLLFQSVISYLDRHFNCTMISSSRNRKHINVLYFPFRLQIHGGTICYQGHFFTDLVRSWTTCFLCSPDYINMAARVHAIAPPTETHNFTMWLYVCTHKSSCSQTVVGLSLGVCGLFQGACEDTLEKTKKTLSPPHRNDMYTGWCAFYSDVHVVILDLNVVQSRPVKIHEAWVALEFDHVAMSLLSDKMREEPARGFTRVFGDFHYNTSFLLILIQAARGMDKIIIKTV